MASNSDTCPIPLWELQEEHRDAMIICAANSSDDRKKAQELQEAIEGFSFDNGVKGKAVIYHEAIPYSRSRISSLDDALKFNTLVFAMYSKDLEKERVNWKTANASLMESIENEERDSTFIPVIWKDGAVLPAYAREPRQLDMRKHNWKNLLKRLINGHLGKRQDRECLRSRYSVIYNRAGNSVSPNDSTSHHMSVPSENQNGLWNMHRQGSHDSVDQLDLHGSGVHPHDIDGNGHGAPQFPWNYMRSLTSERGLCYLGALGFVGLLVSLALLKLKARGPGT